MKSKPASATPIAEPGPPPAPGPACSPSAAGKARVPPARAAAGLTTSRSLCGSKAARSWNNRRAMKETLTKANYPKIAVSPPGPKAQKIIALDQECASPSYIKEYPLVMAGGSGAMVEDVDGNRYIDWMAGIAVSSTGYNHPKVVKAVQEAAGKFLHICGTDFYYEAFSNLCEKLSKSVKGK